MTLTDRFAAYAAAFEDAYASDDWTKVGSFFAEDAVYDTVADPPFASRHEGRAAILASFKQVLDSFDRLFETRAVEFLTAPAERDGQVSFRWAAIYTLAGAPNLRIEGEETATYVGDLIHRLEDRWPSASSQQALAYMAEHAAKLSRER